MSEQLKELMRGYESGYPQQLAERFPRIVGQIVSLWNSPEELTDYIQKLLVADRHDRQGFPPAIAQELFVLSRVYDEIQQKQRESNDVWQQEVAEAKAELERLGVAVNNRSLFIASERKNRDALVLLLRAGMSPDIRDEREWTPLMVASFEGNEEIAFILMEHGANLSARDRDGYTPLHWAAFNGYETVVKLLLRKGAPANIRSRFGVTPLLQAAAQGHLAVVQALLSAGASVNEPTDEGWTALHKAVANGHIVVVEALLENGGDLLASHNRGITPFLISQKCAYPEIRESIKKWVTRATAGRCASATDSAVNVTPNTSIALQA